VQVIREQSQCHYELRGRNQVEDRKVGCQVHDTADHKLVPLLNRLVYLMMPHHDVMSGSMSNGYLWGDRDFLGRHKFHSAPAVDAACFVPDHNQLLMSRTLDRAVTLVLDLSISAYDHVCRCFEYNDMFDGILNRQCINKISLSIAISKPTLATSTRAYSNVSFFVFCL
jgi:hypothetical protein